MAKGIFEEQSNLDECVHNIMEEAQELLSCERCMVFLIDEVASKNTKVRSCTGLDCSKHCIGVHRITIHYITLHYLTLHDMA